MLEIQICKKKLLFNIPLSKRNSKYFGYVDSSHTTKNIYFRPLAFSREKYLSKKFNMSRERVVMKMWQCKKNFNPSHGHKTCSLLRVKNIWPPNSSQKEEIVPHLCFIGLRSVWPHHFYKISWHRVWLFSDVFDPLILRKT